MNSGHLQVSSYHVRPLQSVCPWPPWISRPWIAYPIAAQCTTRHLCVICERCRVVQDILLLRGHWLLRTVHDIDMDLRRLVIARRSHMHQFIIYETQQTVTPTQTSSQWLQAATATAFSFGMWDMIPACALSSSATREPIPPNC